MGYQPRIKSPKGAIHGYKKSLREKRKDRERIRRGIAKPIGEEKHSATEREVSELTLKQLHTLGSQKFGSSPFSEHFDRWLTNVTAVLNEFKSQPNIGADDQFVTECAQTLFNIRKKLEVIWHKETALDQELISLSDWRNRLKQINKEYATLKGVIKVQRNREIKSLYCVINRLQREQDEVIRMKTGFFRGISKKNREQKEIGVVNELKDKQTELELVMLDFSAKQKELRAEYDRKREPVLEEIKKFCRIIQTLETDSSLEERWFACEALVDAINSFLQRKAAQLSSGSN
jgi:small-conductance mechanosensitive channel